MKLQVLGISGRHLRVVLLVFLMPLSAFAQKQYFVKAGPLYSTITNKYEDQVNWKFSFLCGGEFRHLLSERSYFSAELVYVRKGFSDPKVRFDYFGLPLGMSIKSEANVYFRGGIEIGLSVGQVEKGEFPIQHPASGIQTDILDYGVWAGLDFPVTDKASVDIRFVHGLRNVDYFLAEKHRNVHVQLSMAYKIYEK